MKRSLKGELIIFIVVSTPMSDFSNDVLIRRLHFMLYSNFKFYKRIVFLII